MKNSIRTSRRVALAAIAACGWLAFAEPLRPSLALEPAPGTAASTAVQGRGQGARGGGRGTIQRKRVLAWADTRNGQAQHESVGHALAVIERLGYDSGMWDTFIRTDSNIIAKRRRRPTGRRRAAGPSLSNVDAIFFMGHREVQLDASQKEELLSFVREGKGFVAAHVGLTAFESWPEFGDLIGARFDRHPINGPGTIINESPTSRRRNTFAPSFPFSDEFYQPKEISREKVDVVLRLDPLERAANPSLHLNGDYPLAWAKMYGKGRVFYGSFAHSRDLGHARHPADVLRGDAVGARAERRRAEAAPDERQRRG